MAFIIVFREVSSIIIGFYSYSKIPLQDYINSLDGFLVV